MANIAQPLASLAIPISDLNYDPANARRHGEKNLDAIKASLAKFGQRKPIVVQREGMIVRAGNGTLAAAKALGWSEIAAVILDDDNSTASQFAIADNRTAELAEWDTETLTSLLDGWDEETREMLGFDAKDVKELLADITPEIVEDEVPEPPADPITKPGDLWLLGDHRVLCGDSTKAEDVARLMDGQKAVMLFTDPPYGMRLETDYKKVHANQELVRSNTYAPVHGDHEDFDPRALLDYFADARTVLLWGADWYYDKLPSGGSFVIWNKRTAEGTKEMRGNHFETCWSREKRRRVVYDHLWSGFTARNRDYKREHPTEKPISLLAQIIRDFDSDAYLIVDPFLGSGTTLIAAEQLGRTCYGMEISPAYCDVIVKRWETLTGKKAQLAKS